MWCKMITFRLLKLNAELKLYKNYNDCWLNELERELSFNNAKYWNELKYFCSLFVT